MDKVSFVFPVYNEVENLQLLYEKITNACQVAKVSYELIFVENGSTDKSLLKIKHLKKMDNNVFYLSLSRNFGHQNALFAGLLHVTGEAVITMDADLQHPPSLVPKMIQKWREGIEVVFTTKNDPKISFLKLQLVRCYYWLISKLSNLQLSFGQSDFRLIDKKVLKVIQQMPEYHKFFRGQISWVGFKQIGLSYDVKPRHKGQTKFSYKDLISFGLDGILSFSRYPLHVVTLCGFIIAGLSFFHLAYYVFIPYSLKVTGVQTDILLPPGWVTIAGALFFFGSIQLISLGIIGEYVGRIYDQTKARPNFIVNEKHIREA